MASTNVSTNPVAAVDTVDLKRKSVHGAVITTGAQAISIAVQITSTALLARLLKPDDYGVMAMVLAVFGFAGLFRDLGLSSAAIQKNELSPALQSNLFWLNVAMGTLLTILLAACSPLLAWFYGKPELAPVSLALSAIFLISSIGTQSGARLVREMQFGRQALTGVAGAVAGLCTSATLAYHGYSYWSLVWGNLLSSFTTTALLVFLSPFRPGLPSRGSGVREMIGFGANVTAFDLVNYFSRNLDNILIGKTWGPQQLGFYSRAYALLMFPIHAIRGPINAVAFPAMSKLQDHPDRLRSYYLKTTSLLALLSMPLTAFFFVTSRPIIEIVLGPRWLSVAPIFSWLALAALIQPAAGFSGSLLLSLGQGRRYFHCGVFNTIIVSISFLLGVHWGAKGVAASYAIANYAVLYPWLWWAFRQSPVRFADFARACTFPAVLGVSSALLCVGLFSHVSFRSPITHIGYTALVFAANGAAMLLFSASGRKHVGLLLEIWRQCFPKVSIPYAL